PSALAAGPGRRARRAHAYARPQGSQGVRRAGVVGAGAWGTALAQVCARAGLETVLWAREAEVVDAVNASHENPLFLPGVTLDAAVRASQDFVDLARSDLVLAVAPAQHLRGALEALAPHLAAGTPVV